MMGMDGELSDDSSTDVMEWDAAAETNAMADLVEADNASLRREIAFVELTLASLRREAERRRA
jgi:hypothetical protein